MKWIIPLRRRSEVFANTALDPAEEVEFQVVRLIDFIAGPGRYLARVHRFHKVRSHQYNHFLFQPVTYVVTEERANDRQVAQAWDTLCAGGQLQLHQASNRQCLPLAKLDNGVRLATI